MQRRSQVTTDSQADFYLIEGDVSITVATALWQQEVNVVILSIVRIQINGSTVARIYAL